MLTVQASAQTTDDQLRLLGDLASEVWSRIGLALDADAVYWTTITGNANGSGLVTSYNVIAGGSNYLWPPMVSPKDRKSVV